MKLASLFQDHLVLQRNKPLPVWGWAAPESQVAVELEGACAKAKADSSGFWRATLPARPEGGPFELIVAGNGAERRIRDVLIGEVWLCSGQSNMAMRVNDAADAAQEIADAKDSGIRMFTVARSAAMAQRAEVGGAWVVCKPETVGAFSAVAYFFGRELRRKLGVAVGLVDSSWGGTMAEAWISRQGLQSDPQVGHYAKRLDVFQGLTDGGAHAPIPSGHEWWQQKVPADPGNEGERLGWHLPDVPNKDWESMDLPVAWQTAGLDFNGVLWFRRSFRIPDAWAGRALELRIGACDKRDYTYFNGEFLGSFGMEDSPDAWREPRVYTVAADRVRPGLQTVAVRVFSEIYQGGMIGPAQEMWCAPVNAPESERVSLTGAWRYRVERDFGEVSTATRMSDYGEHNPNTPSALFNGMIAPLLPYALRGFIWYQGESNVGRAAEYRALLSCLIRDWRRLFGQGELPFYIVQLANFMARRAMPTESWWAKLREAQRFVLASTPNTGLAVAIDVGDAKDIHPKNKQAVGRRLAACALAADYGIGDEPGASPMPLAAFCRASDVVVGFSNAGAGLRTSDERPPAGFAVAGADRVFYWAEAGIEGKNAVVLSSKSVQAPCWVRYAWADNPECNLRGSSDLPAVPFEIPVPYGTWLNEAWV